MLLVHDATGDVDACYGAPQGTLEKKTVKQNLCEISQNSLHPSQVAVEGRDSVSVVAQPIPEFIAWPSRLQYPTMQAAT